MHTALRMASMLDGLPRYPKMHPCGVVLSRDPIHDLTPTFISGKGWPTTHFDMDDVEAVGLIKLDILAQGGLAVLRDTRTTLASRGLTLDLAALEVGASAIILVHNHPSGDPTPSRADIEMTNQIQKAGAALNIRVHDHLVIGHKSEVSFKGLGLL